MAPPLPSQRLPGDEEEEDGEEEFQAGKHGVSLTRGRGEGKVGRLMVY